MTIAEKLRELRYLLVLAGNYSTCSVCNVSGMHDAFFARNLGGLHVLDSRAI